MIQQIKSWFTEAYQYVRQEVWPKVQKHFQENPESLEFAQKLMVAFGAWLILQTVPGIPIVGAFVSDVGPHWLARSIETTILH